MNANLSWRKLSKISVVTLGITIIHAIIFLFLFILMVKTGTPVISHTIDSQGEFTYAVKLQEGNNYRFYLSTTTNNDVRVICRIFEGEFEIFSNYLSNYGRSSSDKSSSFIVPKSGTYTLIFKVQEYKSSNKASITLEQPEFSFIGFSDGAIALFFVGSTFLTFCIFLLSLHRDLRLSTVNERKRA